MLREFEAATRSHTFVPVSVHNYYTDYGGALAYASSVGYPCDGVVAIADGSTSARKVKEVKSIELRVSENCIVAYTYPAL
jgi:hypothetical protein